MPKYNVIWVEHKNNVIEAKNRKDAMKKASAMIHDGRLKGGTNDFSIEEITTKFFMLKCPKCKKTHWTAQRCKNA